MTFPYISEENFELGTLGHFDAEADDGARLDYPHYSELARFPNLLMPWRGAYCMRVDLAKATNDAYVQETGDWDMTAGTNEIYLRFMLFLSSDLTMATTNEFAVMQFWSSTSTVECGVYINYTTANGYRIGIGEASASSFLPISLGQWHTVDVFFDPAGSSNSTLDLWVDGGAATQVGSFTSADISSGVVGVIGQDAGTTKGFVLFDRIVTDDARLFPEPSRFPEVMQMTKTGHAFVGGGIIDNASLISGNGTDCTLAIFDTDDHYGSTEDEAGEIALGPIRNTAAYEVVDTSGLPVQVTRGAFVVLAGTNPAANIQIRKANGYGSDGAIRAVGHRRKAPAYG